LSQKYLQVGNGQAAVQFTPCTLTGGGTQVAAHPSSWQNMPFQGLI
jgi:hypothetical protein